MSYGPNIKSLRERDNLSQKELAEKLARDPAGGEPVGNRKRWSPL
jgi:hypothetical protein